MKNLRVKESFDKVGSFHRTAFSEKNNFLRFIYDLGKTGLCRLFRFPGEKNLSVWWFSLVAEKAPLKSDAYAKLISEIIGFKNEEHSTNKTFRDPGLLQFISGFKTIVFLVLKSVYAKLFIRNFCSRLKKFKNMDYTIISYFPLLNKDRAQEGYFENKYISPFHRVLEKKRRGKYSHVCLPVDVDGFNFRDAVKLAGKFSQTQSVFLLEEFFKLRHFPLIIFYYVYFAAIFALNIGRIKKSVLYTYHGGKHSVWHIFKNDFYKSFCGPTLASSLWYVFVFKELTSRLRKKSKVICICEMQWWERALYFFTKKNGLISIGYQHTIVPELLLNYFNDTGEIKEEMAAVESCPLPDYIATVGEIPAKLFRKYGWPVNRVIQWGAQRFDQLKDRSSSDVVPWNEKENYFVCAFSISPVDAENILFFLEKAFGNIDINASYRIYLKSHPALDLQSLIYDLNIHLNPMIFRVTETPLDVLMLHAKGLIVTESSASFDALINGSPVIVPRFRGMLDCNPLSYITDLPVYADSPEELLHMCNQIVCLKESPVDGKKVRHFLHEYLYFPANDDVYLDTIDTLAGIKHR